MTGLCQGNTSTHVEAAVRGPICCSCQSLHENNFALGITSNSHCLLYTLQTEAQTISCAIVGAKFVRDVAGCCKCLWDAVT